MPGSDCQKAEGEAVKSPQQHGGPESGEHIKADQPSPRHNVYEKDLVIEFSSLTFKPGTLMTICVYAHHL